MASFFNQATLSYNGISTNSNITVGELVEVLSMTKTAIADTYTDGDNVVYVINIVNSGTLPFTGLTLTDNLGAYTVGEKIYVPLTYNTGTLRYYTGGTLQTTPTVTAGNTLEISDFSVPANSNATIVYQVKLNEFAPLAAESSVTNTATLTGGGITTPITATETINARSEAVLTISKAICPSTVTENGEVTYTFVIQNTGNTAAVAADNASVTDTFNPILNGLSVTFNGTAWTLGDDYAYNTATGEFATVPGKITVPAATFTQDTETGVYTITPGTAILTVKGTI
mgnify:FL=1